MDNPKGKIIQKAGRFFTETEKHLTNETPRHALLKKDQ